MKHPSRLALPAIVAVATLAAGCSTTHTFVDYSRGALYSTETVGNVPYVEVGPASASERGFFWENCWELAEQAVVKLRASAERYGANNVSNVRWLNHADGTYSDTPICTTGWGWFTAFVLPGFGPWVKATEVQGRLVFADETQLSRYRTEVARRSAQWQKTESERLALAKMTDEDRARVAAEKAAAEKAEADRIAAEKAAAEKAAAEKAAAERAAAEKAMADFEAARKAQEAQKAASKKKTTAKK